MPYPIKNQPPRGLFLFRRGCRRPPPGRRTIYNLLQDLPRRRRKQTITLIPPKQAKPLSHKPSKPSACPLIPPQSRQSPFLTNHQNQALALLSHPKTGKAPFCKSSKPSACPLIPPQNRQSPFLTNPQNQALAPFTHPKAGEDSPSAQKLEWEVEKEKRPRMPEAPFLFSWEGVLCYSR